MGMDIWDDHLYFSIHMHHHGIRRVLHQSPDRSDRALTIWIDIRVWRVWHCCVLLTRTILASTWPVRMGESRGQDTVYMIRQVQVPIASGSEQTGYQNCQFRTTTIQAMLNTTSAVISLSDVYFQTDHNTQIQTPSSRTSTKHRAR